MAFKSSPAPTDRATVPATVIDRESRTSAFRSCCQTEMSEREWHSDRLRGTARHAGPTPNVTHVPMVATAANTETRRWISGVALTGDVAGTMSAKEVCRTRASSGAGAPPQKGERQAHGQDLMRRS